MCRIPARRAIIWPRIFESQTDKLRTINVQYHLLNVSTTGNAPGGRYLNHGSRQELNAAITARVANLWVEMADQGTTFGTRYFVILNICFMI